MMHIEKYRDRTEAGKVLAQALQGYADKKDILVLALPRGGVPVGYEIAKALHIPLDVFIVRKLGVPGHPELAMGALAVGGTHIFNDDIIKQLNISEEEIQAVIAREQQELKRRELAYRDEEAFPVIKSKTVILVDDGVATGATMRAAIKSLRQMEPAKIVMAVPVMDYRLYEQFQSLVDELICPLQPRQLYAVGAWYDNFSQTEDAEVYQLLSDAKNFVSPA